MRFNKNVQLDAKMVRAAQQGGFVPYCISIGMTTSEAFGRAEWLKKQSKQYTNQVIQEVRRLEIEAIKNKLKK